MRNFNQVILLGHVAADPDMIKTNSGRNLAKFALAVNRSWPETLEDKTREVDFHRIVAWNKLAEIVEKYIKKGSKILISGQIINHQFEDQNKQMRYMSEIHVENIEILSWKEGESESEVVDKLKSTKKVKVKA